MQQILQFTSHYFLCYILYFNLILVFLCLYCKFHRDQLHLLNFDYIWNILFPCKPAEWSGHGGWVVSVHWPRFDFPLGTYTPAILKNYIAPIWYYPMTLWFSQVVSDALMSRVISTPSTYLSIFEYMKKCNL